MITRVSHSRFLKNIPVRKKEEYDKVVTTVWTFDPNTSYLKYASTVFKKNNNTEFWNKKQHLNTAYERYENSPLVIYCFFPNYIDLEDFDKLSMDWYIAEHLIYKFGCYNKNENIEGIHGKANIYLYGSPFRFKSLHFRSPSYTRNNSDHEEFPVSKCISVSLFILIATFSAGSAFYSSLA